MLSPQRPAPRIAWVFCWVLDQAFGIESTMMTEIHAYTSDQQLLDHTHRDLRRARAGAQNLIPTTSSSIGAVQRCCPQLYGRIQGYSFTRADAECRDG